MKKSSSLNNWAGQNLLWSPNTTRKDDKGDQPNDDVMIYTKEEANRWRDDLDKKC